MYKNIYKFFRLSTPTYIEQFMLVYVYARSPVCRCKSHTHFYVGHNIFDCAFFIAFECCFSNVECVLQTNLATKYSWSEKIQILEYSLVEHTNNAFNCGPTIDQPNQPFRVMVAEIRVWVFTHLWVIITSCFSNFTTLENVARMDIQWKFKQKGQYKGN